MKSSILRPFLAATALLAITHSAQATDLLGYWNFNDNSIPAVAQEVTGKSPDAALGGPAAYTADAGGHSGTAGDRALDLGVAGNGASATVPAGPHLDAAFNNNSIAVSVWQFNRGFSNSSTFWIASPTAGSNQRGMQAHVPWGNGTIFFDHAGCCGGAQRITTGGAVTNRWQHFVFQKDAAGRKQIWIDGVLAVEQASGAGALLAFDGRINIGAEINNNANSFNGIVDELAVFSETLTPAQIQALAAGASADEVADPPTAVADSGQTDETALMTMVDTGASLLDNDIAAGFNAAAPDPTSALGAAVTVNLDGTFTYDPSASATLEAYNEGVMTTDMFSYTVSPLASAPAETVSTGSAGTVLGGLLGGDLTDLDDIHNEVAYNPTSDFGGFDAEFLANDEPGFGGGEFAFNVFDNAVGGGAAKWCCNTPGPTTPDGVGLWVAAHFDQPYVLTHFTITSSNDTPGRDPRVWAIEGSNDGANWTQIFSYSNTAAAPFTARNQVLLYTSSNGRTDLTGGTTHFESSSAYRYIRYFVDSTGIAAGAAHALNELEFFGQPGSTGVVTVKVTGHKR